MVEWKINKIRECCHSCEQAFVADQEVVSVVSEDQEEGKPVRSDYCPRCVPPLAIDEFYWETRWTPPAERKRRVDFDRLRQLFEHWIVHPPRAQQSLVYLIALLLVRRRFFRMLDLVSEDGVDFLRLRRPGPDQKPFLCPAPLLRASELPALRINLESLLDGEFEEDDMSQAVPSETTES